MLLVSPRIHALTFAAYLSIAAFLSTLPAVEAICGQVDTFVLAAIRSCAAFNMAYLWVLITCQRHPIPFLGKESDLSLGERLVLHFGKMLLTEKWPKPLAWPEGRGSSRISFFAFACMREKADEVI